MAQTSRLQTYEDEDGIGVPAMYVGPVGKAALPLIEDILQDSRGYVSALEQTTADVAAAAAAPQPPKKKPRAVECSVCKVASHRIAKQDKPTFAEYTEHRRKNMAAAACVVLLRAQCCCVRRWRVKLI